MAVRRHSLHFLHSTAPCRRRSNHEQRPGKKHKSAQQTLSLCQNEQGRKHQHHDLHSPFANEAPAPDVEKRKVRDGHAVGGLDGVAARSFVADAVAR
jgi:hypothetical protein